MDSAQEKGSKLTNLTPHPIQITTPQGTLNISPEPLIARLVSTSVAIGALAIGGHLIPIYREVPAEPTGLPDFRGGGEYFIVSRALAERYPDRTDLLFPSRMTSDPATGEILSCSGLSRVAQGDLA